MGSRSLALISLLCVLGCGAEPPASRFRDGAIAGAAGMAPPTGGTIGGVGPVTGGVGGSTGGTPPITGGAGGPTGGTLPTTGGAGGMGVVGHGVFDAGGTDPNRNNVAAGGVCARLAKIQCAGEQFCCDAPGRDRAACESAQTTSCAAKAYIDAISLDPLAGFDPAHAAMAFAQLETLASTCDPSIANYGASALGFAGIFKGTRAPGADCGPGGGLLNPPSKTQAAVALASCNTIETTACMPTTSAPLDPWKCAAKAGGGAPCLTDLNCMTGLGCPNPTLAGGSFGLGTCSPKKPAGMPCEFGNECEAGYCVANVCAGRKAGLSTPACPRARPREASFSAAVRIRQTRLLDRQYFRCSQQRARRGCRARGAR
jgi:hypothetical protein